MKVKVNRSLSSGVYHVNFEVGHFTPEEIAKMESFGAPTITLRWTTSNGKSIARIALNRIANVYDATFDTEAEAKKYEEAVLSDIRTALERLRQRNDEFSSSDEVEL